MFHGERLAFIDAIRPPPRRVCPNRRRVCALRPYQSAQKLHSERRWCVFSRCEL